MGMGIGGNPVFDPTLYMLKAAYDPDGTGVLNSSRVSINKLVGVDMFPLPDGVTDIILTIYGQGITNTVVTDVIYV